MKTLLQILENRQPNDVAAYMRDYWLSLAEQSRDPYRNAYTFLAYACSNWLRPPNNVVFPRTEVSALCRGDVVNIYEDPKTEHTLHGAAVLIQQVEYGQHGLELWYVRFSDIRYPTPLWVHKRNRLHFGEDFAESEQSDFSARGDSSSDSSREASNGCDDHAAG